MINLKKKHLEITYYFDDILSDSSESSHKELVIKFLSIARGAGLKVNRNKVQLANDQVVSVYIQKMAFHPDHQKLTFIIKFQLPTCKKDLKLFLETI